MVHLHAYVTCWTRSVKRSHYYILSLSERLRRLTCADAEIGLGNLRQGGESGLPLLLLSLKLILEVGCQRLVPQCRHEDALRTFCRGGYHGIRQLVDVSKQSCLQKSVYHFVSTKTIYIFLAEIGCLLLSVGFHHNAQHLASLTTHHGSHRTANGRCKLHFWAILVDKQSVASLDIVAFLHYDLRCYTYKVGGSKTVLAVRLQLYLFLLSRASKLYVQAFTQFNYIDHYNKGFC